MSRKYSPRNFDAYRPDLVSDLRAGSWDAYEVIFKIYYEAICVFISRMTDEYRVEDIAKEIFITLWMRRTNFSDLVKIQAFLYVSAKNACRNIARNQKAKEEYVNDFYNPVKLQEQAISAQDTINAALTKTQVLKMIYEKANSLPLRRKQIFEFAFVSGLSNGEIAKSMGISIFTVKEQKAQMIKQLKNSLRHIAYP